MKPDRVVIGTSSKRAKEIMERLYAPFIRQGNPLIIMDEKSAELTKYAANAFLAMKISFMNELANLSEIVGANIDKVRLGIGSDSRIGKRFLFPGVGYGGSCFPKDVLALAKTAEENKYDFQILKSVMNVNDKQKTILIPKIKSYFDNNLKGKHFAMWGLAFKPNTDDIREAPSLYLIEALTAAGATVTSYDPEAMENVEQRIGSKIKYAENAYDSLHKADALIIVTEWPEFRSPDFKKIKNYMNDAVIFDGRNLFEPEQMKELGFHYESIGREVIFKKEAVAK
jgi:UDPglucose 6-dehydrogenase